ncbi:MAG: response regulator [Proteobacteria bacterium]|nr:response regulator [Pseudomonadota bacterium]MBU1582485.1 response regulator [Pseudomonadota bacterium]MBU2452385.1 response regulator [Pseudomonadota bacterium]MBU2628250.1 response regulator [Pseudomonadota bacterium]
MKNKPSYEEMEAYVNKLEKKVYKALRTEQVNKTLFDIATALNAASSLEELYQSIHKILANLMDMTNFYIAIYYQKKNAIRFVYCVDTQDNGMVDWIENFTQNPSLTGDVILAKRPLLLKENDLLKLGKAGRIRGPVPKIWLGVPLMIKGNVLGVMTVQSYINPEQFNDSDVEVLSFVSDQIALSIQKKRAEELLKKTREKLIQSEKLEAIGTLAGGIAHDFNNTLSVTLGNINLAQLLSTAPELTTLLADAETSVMQAKALAAKFIVFSKGGIILKKQINSREFIETAIASIAQENSIHYSLQIGDVPQMMAADPQQLKEALKNIILNAHEATKNPKKVSIFFHSHQTKKGYGVISVIDQGRGIEKENLEKVFEPYFSTKPLGKDKGIGLGMSIAYSIVKKHQGEIHISSTPGQGTRVDIIFPIFQKENLQKQDDTVSQKKQPLTEHHIDQPAKVLVMDDDRMIREICVKILSRLGYEAIVAKDGEQAIQLYSQLMNAGEKISLAILDLEVKQGMGGALAIKELLKINPDLKAVIASGYSSDIIMENCRDYGFALALSKPFSMNTLKDVLERLQHEFIS